MKRIAVIGSGIAGLSAAYLLSRRHDVHLFEKDARLGGHTHTVTIESRSGLVALDTGFLVHNDRTYPLLVRLFTELGVETRGSDMCFSVTSGQGDFEYSSRGVRGFFAQPQNIVNPAHLFLLREILRFNKAARAELAAPDTSRTVGEFLEVHQFGRSLAERYILPMASAIWSASIGAIRAFPFDTLAHFLDNHGLLAVNGQPQWKVVRGGSHTYLPLISAPFAPRIHLSSRIRAVARTDEGVMLSFSDRPALRFDAVVFACHGDQVLPLLADPTDAERSVFSRFSTTTNDVWLHTDESWLPRRPAARASWNYRINGATDAPPAVTYHLNRLQGLNTSEQFCVTLNPGAGIRPDAVLRRFSYAHPLYTHDAVAAQRQWSDVSGVRHTHYCGAYWFHGFHEDGVRSAARVAAALGVAW